MEVEGNNRVHVRGIDKQKVGTVGGARCAKSARPMPIRKRVSAIRARYCASSRASRRRAKPNCTSVSEIRITQQAAGPACNQGCSGEIWGRYAERQERKVHLRKVRQVRGYARRFPGRPERPRLSVFRSLKHIYAQVIDDTTGRTIVAASSQEALKGPAPEADVRPQDGRSRLPWAKRWPSGHKAAGITRVVFDRGGCKYHGRVKALADGSREGGLEF